MAAQPACGMAAQPACGMAAHDKVWPWTLGNAVRLTFAWWKMTPCSRSALTCMQLTFSAWYYPRVLRETGAKTREGRQEARNGREKRVYHLTLLFWPSWRVARFSRERLRRVLRKKAAVILDLHTLTSADLDLHSFTSADLDLHTITPADLDLHTITPADLDLHIFTPAQI